MLTLLKITEELLDSNQLRADSGAVLCNSDHMSMDSSSSSSSGSSSFIDYNDDHNHHQYSHQVVYEQQLQRRRGCNARLDREPSGDKSLKTVSFVSDDNGRIASRTEDDKPTKAVGASSTDAKLRSWISVPRDINELSSEPERGISAVPHKDHRPPSTSARKRRERLRSVPTDGPAMTDLETPLGRPRRNSDGATIIRRFLVTPVEDAHEDSPSPPPLPKTPPPISEPLLFVAGECSVDVSPCVRPSILKKSPPSDCAPKSILRTGTFTLHTDNCKNNSENDSASSKKRSGGTIGDFRAKLRTDDEYEIVRGPEIRLPPPPTIIRSGTSEQNVVSADQWLGDRGVEIDVEYPGGRTPLRRSISEGSGLRPKKVSFDLENVDVFQLEQSEFVFDEQSANRFQQFLSDSVALGSLQLEDKEHQSSVSSRSGADDSDGGQSDHGIELVTKTLTDDDKTWLKT